MLNFFARFIPLGALLATLNIASTALAIESPASPSAQHLSGNDIDVSQVLAPVLVHQVAAEYPPQAVKDGRNAIVVLYLTIDEQGQVVDAKIPKPVGYGFDEAALKAAQQFQFRPATLDDKPVSVQIEYRVHFVLDVPDVAQTDPSQTKLNTVNGLILEKGSRKALPGAQIQITELGLMTEADERGEFSLRLPAGRYTIEVAAERHHKAKTSLTVKGLYLTNVEIYLPSELDERYTTVVRERREDRAEEPVIRLSREELRRVPGTFGDPVRVLQTLPGVARPRTVEGDIVVRGSEPGNTPLYLGGFPVPFLFHFGILQSIVDPAFVEAIDFYPGSVPLRFGNAAQGVVDVRSSEGKAERVHAEMQIGDADIAGAATLPLFDNRLRLDIGGRRSYVGLVLPALMSAASFVASSGEISFNVVPKYWDYNLRLSGGSSSFRPYVNLFGAHDSIVINIILVRDFIDQLLSLRNAEEDDVPDKLTLYDQTFHHLVTGFDARVEGGIELSLSALLGTRTSLNLLDTRGFFETGMIMRRDTQVAALRGDLRIPVSSWLALRLGTDLELRDEYIHPTDELKILSEIFPEAREQPYEIGFYSALEGKPWLGGRITLGSRMQLDHQHTQDYQRADPRFVLEQDAGYGITARFAVARQTQLPDFKKTSSALGGTDLPLTISDQVMGGLRAKLPWGLELGIDGYVSRMQGLSMLEPGWELVLDDTSGEASIAPTMRFVPAQGKAYGLEFSLRRRPTGRFYGWMSYSISRSLRSTNEISSFVGDYDQPHHFIAVAAYKLGWGVEISARFRLASGNPYTPFVGAFDVDTRTYQELRGKHNSARDPWFHQLDLRLDKTFTFDRFKAGLFVDLMNVYMAQNPLPISEMHLYSYDHLEVMPVGSLPLIPMFGMTLEY